MSETITLPREVVESLVALSGSGLYGTPTQRYHLADAKDALAKDALAPTRTPAPGEPEQLALFDASVYEVSG